MDDVIKQAFEKNQLSDYEAFKSGVESGRELGETLDTTPAYSSPSSQHSYNAGLKLGRLIWSAVGD